MIIATEISSQLESPAFAQEFMELIAAQPSVKANHEAALLCSMEIVKLKMLRGPEFHVEVKAVLDEFKPAVEALVGAEPVVHAAYYRVACAYFGAVGPAEKFYKNALMFLAYTQYEDIPAKERFDLAVDISIAALTGDGVFNFGEVVRDQIITDLLGYPCMGLLILIGSYILVN